MELLVRDEFTGANGSAWDTGKWAAVEKFAGVGTVDIQSNRGRAAVPARSGGWSFRALSTVPVNGALDMRVRFQWEQVVINEQYFLGFGSGAWQSDAIVWQYVRPVNGYGVQVRRSSGATLTEYGLYRFDTAGSGSAVNLAMKNDNDVVLDTNEWWLRFRFAHGRVMAKRWPVTRPEPSLWDVQAGAGFYAGGIPYLAFSNSSATSTAQNLYWDDFTVERDGRGRIGRSLAHLKRAGLWTPRKTVIGR